MKGGKAEKGGKRSPVRPADAVQRGPSRGAAKKDWGPLDRTDDAVPGVKKGERRVDRSGDRKRKP